MSTLKFVKNESLTRAVDFGIESTFSEGPSPGPFYELCHNFRPPLPLCTYTYAFNLHPLPPSIYFVNDMRKVYFVNYHQSKNPRER